MTNHTFPSKKNHLIDQQPQLQRSSPNLRTMDLGTLSTAPRPRSPRAPSALTAPRSAGRSHVLLLERIQKAALQLEDEPDADVIQLAVSILDVIGFEMGDGGVGNKRSD